MNFEHQFEGVSRILTGYVMLVIDIETLVGGSKEIGKHNIEQHTVFCHSNTAVFNFA